MNLKMGIWSKKHQGGDDGNGKKRKKKEGKFLKDEANSVSKIMHPSNI